MCFVRLWMGIVLAAGAGCCLASNVGPKKDRLDPEAYYKIVLVSDFDEKNIDDCVKLSSLDKTSGFMHLSFGRQVAGTMGKFFKGASKLLVLELSSEALIACGLDVRIESNKPGGESYPHVYGPQKIPVLAVKCVLRFEERTDGTWGITE